MRLLDTGAQLELADEDRWTALSWAAANGQLAILQLLIERGARLDVYR